MPDGARTIGLSAAMSAAMGDETTQLPAMFRRHVEVVHNTVHTGPRSRRKRPPRVYGTRQDHVRATVTIGQLTCGKSPGRGLSRLAGRVARSPREDATPRSPTAARPSQRSVRRGRTSSLGGTARCGARRLQFPAPRQARHRFGTQPRLRRGRTALPLGTMIENWGARPTRGRAPVRQRKRLTTPVGHNASSHADVVSPACDDRHRGRHKPARHTPSWHCRAVRRPTCDVPEHRTVNSNVCSTRMFA